MDFSLCISFTSHTVKQSQREWEWMLSQTVVYSVENCLPRVCVLFSWICLFASHSIILLQPITMLSFIGKSEYLVSASRGSKSQLSLWSLSKLSESWSYKLQAEGWPNLTHFLLFYCFYFYFLLLYWKQFSVRGKKKKKKIKLNFVKYHN